MDEIDLSAADSRSFIIEACRRAKSQAVNIISPHNTTNLVVKLTDTTAVKFGIGVTRGEAFALDFASRNLDPQCIRVPRFLQFFSETDSYWPIGYLVMSLLEGTLFDEISPSRQAPFVPKIIKALQHMHALTSPRPGPLDGSHARGLLWSENTSGRSFECCNDLQGYLDERLAVKGTAEICVTDVPMSFCHMDVAPRNMVVDPDGSIGLLDWGCAGFYPKCFETWAVQMEVCTRGGQVLEQLFSDILQDSTAREQTEVKTLWQVYSVNLRYAL